MTRDSHSVLIICLRRLLRPVAVFCLRFSLNIQELLELSKQVFIEVAAEEMVRRGERVNVSRLSVATGMHRRDVMRIFRDEGEKESNTGLIRKIIGQWQSDKRFCRKGNRPKVLSVEGDDSEFRQLCRAVSRDVNPGTVLFELERLGALERSKGGVRLVTSVYVPKENPEEGYRMLAADCEDLMFAVQENVLDKLSVANLHAKTEYDNIPVSAVPEIKGWLLREGSIFHSRVRDYLARFDKDISGTPSKEKKVRRGSGARVALGTFSRVELSGGQDR